MYEIALHFRVWDVAGWLSQISWRQLQLWLQFREVQPFGEEREDLRAGQIVAAIYNVNRAEKKAKVWSASDAVRMLEPVVMPERGKRGRRSPGPVDPATEEALWREYKEATKAAVRVAFGNRDKPPTSPKPPSPRSTSRHRSAHSEVT